MQNNTSRFNRLYLYLIVCIFSIVLIAIVKIMINERLGEVLLEALIMFPMTLGYIYLIYSIRKTALNTKAYKVISIKHPIVKTAYFTFFVLLKAIITTIVLRWAVLYLFDDDGSETFDLGFWALFATSLLTIAFVYTLELYLESQTEKIALRERMQKYEYDQSLSRYLTLKKQVNPHFLFNSFNNLAGLISSDKNTAEEFLSELSAIYRYTLEQEKEVVVELKEELKLVDSYMKLQCIRHKDAICLKKHIDSRLMNWLLPPMTLELLLENALKHNQFGKEAPLHITIETKELSLQVTNNYRPKNKASLADSLGLGIKNLMSQYDFIGNDKPTFKIIDQKYIATIPLIVPEFD